MMLPLASVTSSSRHYGMKSWPAGLHWQRAASGLTASPASRQNSTSWWEHSARRASVGFWISSKSRLSSLPTHSWWEHSARSASVGFWISSKSRLSSFPAHQLTNYQKVDQLLKMESLSARRPSKLLAAMLETCQRGQETNIFFAHLSCAGYQLNFASCSVKTTIKM